MVIWLVVLIFCSMWLERNARRIERKLKMPDQVISYIAEEADVWIQTRFRVLGMFAQQISISLGREIVNL